MNIYNIENGVKFGFTSKNDMKIAKGQIFSDNISLMKNMENLTHWTPNLYREGYFVGDKVCGHSEQNLRQINCFVVDIDNKNINVSDIVFKLEGLNLMPSFILDTPNGYHVYFLLENPCFISSKNNFKSLKAAKHISKYIKSVISNKIEGVDIGCNDFGIFRCPNSKNIIYKNEDMKYDFSYLNSLAFENRDKREHKNTVLNKSSKRQIDQSWFSDIINSKNIGPKKAYARNNTIFTLALACYSSNLSKDECSEKLFTFNQNLAIPLKYEEVIRSINSAYSGKYKGASKEFIDGIKKEWGIISNNKSGSRNFYKFKKNRDERENSHFEEWENDLIKYIKNKTANTKNKILKTSHREISKDLNIPISSLKIVIKNLLDRNIIIIKTVRGRCGYTSIAFLCDLIKNILIKKENSHNKACYDCLAHYDIYEKINPDFVNRNFLKKPMLELKI